MLTLGAKTTCVREQAVLLQGEGDFIELPAVLEPFAGPNKRSSPKAVKRPAPPRPF